MEMGKELSEFVDLRGKGVRDIGGCRQSYDTVIFRGHNSSTVVVKFLAPYVSLAGNRPLDHAS